MPDLLFYCGVSLIIGLVMGVVFVLSMGLRAERKMHQRGNQNG